MAIWSRRRRLTKFLAAQYLLHAITIIATAPFKLIKIRERIVFAVAFQNGAKKKKTKTFLLFIQAI